jgi:sugar/nucleoside kinase (ribokinase family)
VPDPDSAAGRVDWVAFLARVLPAVDVFSPSVDELRAMLRAPSQSPIDLDGVRGLAERMLALGPAVFALKLGEQGLYVRTARGGAAFDRVCSRLALEAGDWRDREVLAPCFRARRVAGTNGSGDSTIAGLLTALLRAEDPVTAATSACAVGACSVEEPDASSGVPTWPDVAARLAAGWPRLPVAGALRGDVPWQVDRHGTMFDPMRGERP